MSKNLENEYKNHVYADIPDLWSRIEAALPEKNVVNSSYESQGDNLINYSVKNVNDKDAPVQFKNIKKSYNDQLSTKDRKAKNGKKKHNYALWSSIAVAGLAMAIIIPVLISVKKADNDSGRTRDRHKETMSIEFDSDAAMNIVAETDDEYDQAYTASTDAFAEDADQIEIDKGIKEGISEQYNDVSTTGASSEEGRFRLVVDIVYRALDEEGEVSYVAVVLVPNRDVESGEHIVLYPSEERFENYQDLQEIDMVVEYVETVATGERAYSICDVIVVK